MQTREWSESGPARPTAASVRPGPGRRALVASPSDRGADRIAGPIAGLRSVLVGSALLVSALLGAGCARGEDGAGAANAGPAALAPGANVVLVTVDTLRADHLAPYGHARPTPALAALAEHSVVFDAAQSTTSWTLPALSSLMTSFASSTHGVWTFQSALDTSFETLAERLAAVGYDTAAVASHVFLGREFGLTQGFTHFDDDLVQQIELSHVAITSDGVTERGVRFIENKAAARDAGVDDAPWFLWVHYFDPHYVYYEHPDFAYGSDDVDRYDSEIAFTDRAVGRLLDALAASGLEDDTIVVFTSDHGEEFGEHGRSYHGLSLYREVLRVPLMLRVPGVEPRRVAEPVSITDVLPTLLGALDVPTRPDETLGGIDLGPQLVGAPLAERPLLAELRRTPETLDEALVLGDWKLVRPLGRADEAELFDRRSDPLEARDLAATRGDVVRRLTVALEREVARAEELGDGFGHVRRNVGADMAEALESLGYIGGGRGVDRAAEAPAREAKLDPPEDGDAR